MNKQRRLGRGLEALLGQFPYRNAHDNKPAEDRPKNPVDQSPPTDQQPESKPEAEKPSAEPLFWLDESHKTPGRQVANPHHLPSGAPQPAAAEVVAGDGGGGKIVEAELDRRHPDRALMLPLDFCSTYCRYCTRSRVVGHGEIVPNEARLDAIFDYLEHATQVRDVLISGGDPLALSDDRLEAILTRLRSIPHIEFVRIGTKMPAVLPQRITPELCAMLRRFHPLWMSLHFVHPDECTPESKEACGRLADAGIPLGSQTVLLQGVNDNVETMRQLVHRLLMMRVRPYYLYQCDPISGSSHFRTPVSRGLEIIAGLRGYTTGYAVPTYVIDAPGGGGKIPINPEYVVSMDEDEVVMRNYRNRIYTYPQHRES